MKPPSITQDPLRLAVLASHGVLDTPAEAGFDDVAQLAAQVCDVPVALVSLVTGDRQWFKARLGFEPSETDLNSSICVHALLEPDLLIIPDLTQDPRTNENPLVTGEPYIRFYAGAPLRTSAGVALGSLCVIDSKPRPTGLTEKQAGALRNLGRQVMSQLEMRRLLAERDALLLERQRASLFHDVLMAIGDNLRDLTSLAEITHAASASIGPTLEASRAGIAWLHDKGEVVEIGSDWTADGTATIAGRHRLSNHGTLLEGLMLGEPLVIENVRSDPRTALVPEPLLSLGIDSMVNVPVRERGKTVAVLFVHDRKPRIWSREELAFLRNVADRFAEGVTRLAAETDQRVLNHELSHRMKNTMAMIQAIGMQTLKTIPDREPVDAFMKRLHALSTAHDVLLKENWVAAGMGNVVRSVLGTFGLPKRFIVSGPDISLGPRATLSLSLLLHELTTNATKYGALSCDAGGVDLLWRVEEISDNETLVMSWREWGGPPPPEPQRNGFGSRLIRMGLVGTGSVDIRYRPTGFEADFRASLDQVRQS